MFMYHYGIMIVVESILDHKMINIVYNHHLIQESDMHVVKVEQTLIVGQYFLMELVINYQFQIVLISDLDLMTLQ